MQHLVSIQILRALAALSVAYGHAAHEVGRVFGLRGDSFAAPLQHVSGAGVDLFFAISGFVMVLSSQRLFGAVDGRRRFLHRRLARIVPVYWFATAIFVVGQVLTGVAARDTQFTAADIIRSLLFIPYLREDLALIQPVYSLGWTLNYEMFFYVLFAAFMGSTARRTVAAVTLLLAALVVFGIFANPSTAVLKFWSHPIVLEFALGALIGLAWLEGWRLPAPVSAALIAAGLVTFALLNPMGYLHVDGQRFVTAGVPMAMILAGAALGRGKTPTVLHPLAALGDASYALYLFHPMALRALGIFALSFGWSNGWLLLAAGLVASIVLALIVYRGFERPLTRLLQGERAAR